MVHGDEEPATSYLAALMELKDTDFAEPGPPREWAARRASMRSPRVSVVILTKNEVRDLPDFLAELPDGLHEVILVESDSADETVRAALRIRPDIVVVRQTRRGKGNALVCGFAACTGDVTVMLDADGSADPAEIPAFVAALVGGADFAKGSRFLTGGGSSDIRRSTRIGNSVLTFVINRLCRTSYTDPCYGYNAFRTDCLDRLALPPTDGPAPAIGDGFEINTLLAARVASTRLKVAEVPSIERDRRCGERNLNTWREGWRVMRTVLSEWRRGMPPTTEASAIRAQKAAPRS